MAVGNIQHDDALDVIGLLRSIDATLKELLALSKTKMAGRASASAPTASAPSVASARDLDGKYGDPEVKFNPRDWSGTSYLGCHFSECDPIFLDLLAGAFDYFGDKAERDGETTSSGKPVAHYKRLDAARARGWAKRLREQGDHSGAVKQAPMWADEPEEPAGSVRW